MRSTANFQTVLSESQNASPLDAELRPDFIAKWPFKVIRFDVNEEPLRGYIVQYNNCGLECEVSEDIVSERSENRHFRPPHSHLTPTLQRSPRISAQNLPCYKLGSVGYIFAILVVVGPKKHVCNATECIIAVQGHFRVNEGRWFWYQSKARIRFPISYQ